MLTQPQVQRYSTESGLRDLMIAETGVDAKHFQDALMRSSGCAAHNLKRCVVTARATFRQRRPTHGIRAPASDRCRRPELL
jgi:hypothetical protein